MYSLAAAKVGFGEHYEFTSGRMKEDVGGEGEMEQLEK